jgi:hypothetical protein
MAFGDRIKVQGKEVEATTNRWDRNEKGLEVIEISGQKRE